MPHGCRLAEMQGDLLDSLLRTMDECHVRRSPQCLFINRVEYWVRNALLADRPIARPRCGERLRPYRVYRGD
eukprot:10056054-Alexandrium_andersonii.AAC.1